MFELPEDLKSLSAADLDDVLGKAREYANQVLTDSPNDVEALSAAKAAFDAVLGEKTSRAETDALRAELSAAVVEPVIPNPTPTPEPPPSVPVLEPEPVTVTATASQAVVTFTPRSTLDAPAPDSGSGLAVMRVAPDVPGMHGGQELTKFSDAAQAITNRLKAYPTVKPMRGDKGRSKASMSKPGPYALDMTGRSYVRHNAVVLQRQFPEELILDTDAEGALERVLKFATTENRLPGGSLVNSAKKQLDAGKAITAAIGWCAPSEPLYALCDLTSMDGLLDIPEIQAARGGYLLPANGGPDFSIIWGGIGDAGDVILTEYDIENGAEKSCFEIPCPDFEDVRLDVAYVCLTGSLLQRRTYPEVVELFSQQAMKALAHKINAAVIARIAAASGTAVVIPADASGDDAASSILSAIDLAVQDIRYRERMARNRTMQVVLPYWALTQIRAALARRYGVAMLNVTDAMILSWFAERGAMPSFVYDWQDYYSGLGTGPGGPTPLTALPTTVQFLIYPAGTWTKIVNEVVSLDTIYDSTLLRENRYTAIFAEDAFNVIQTCPISRLYTAQADPSGVVGCCP